LRHRVASDWSSARRRDSCLPREYGKPDERRGLPLDPGLTGFALAALAALLHGATASNYGYFRDELYFIACSKHLAWGYVDQPPFVALAAWLASPFGYALIALRALPVLCAALTVYVVVALTRELGGGRFAQALAGIATLVAPAYLLLGNTLTTTSFEPLAWTLTTYAVVKIVRGDRRAYWWIALALAVAFGGYAKYSIGLLAAGLAAGLLMTRERRILLTPWLGIAVVVTLLLLAPNIAWQAGHGWPMIEVLQGDAAHRPAFQTGVALEYRSLAANAAAFSLEQLLYTLPLAVPIWMAGIVAPFLIPALRSLRFISVAYLVAFAVAAAAGAKGYYIVGIYASLFAIGAVAFEKFAPWLRTAAVAVVAVSGVIVMPLALPILPVDTLVSYTKALGLTGRDGTPPHLIQPVFAEEFGWGRLARDVAAVYTALPSKQRAQTAIYADTYGDAGALDFFGPGYGLPPAISSQNAYYLWGTRGYDGAILIAIGASRVDLLRKYYRNVTLVRTSTEPYKWIVEGPAPIYLCRNPIAPLQAIWPNLRWYGA
jgi:Dolichyl-phosphate-mannose-protein mannosyltransferase